MGRLRNLVMTRNSYFLAAVVATAFVGDLAADYAIDGAWRWSNKGVACRVCVRGGSVWCA